MFKKNLFTLLAIVGLLWSCGGNSSSETDSATETAENPATEAVSQLEKEHELVRPGYPDSVNTGLIAEDNLRSSPRRETSAEVGGARVTVNYGSPGKRGRTIWQGLVAYDEVWVSGAHWATAVSFSKDVKVGDTQLPAGMYAFFTIPGEQEWTLILNKNFDQHLADNYAEAEDVVRIKVKPEMLDQVVQRLTYGVTATGDKTGELSLAWDQVKVKLPFEVM